MRHTRGFLYPVFNEPPTFFCQLMRLLTVSIILLSSRPALALLDVTHATSWDETHVHSESASCIFMYIFYMYINIYKYILFYPTTHCFSLPPRCSSKSSISTTFISLFGGLQFDIIILPFIFCILSPAVLLVVSICVLWPSEPPNSTRASFGCWWWALWRQTVRTAIRILTSSR